MNAKNAELLTRDIKLLALWQRHKDCFARADRLVEKQPRIEDSGDEQALATLSARQSRALGDVHEVARQIAETPASTFAGLVIKLRIAAVGLSPEYPRDSETDELNLMAALADAERLAGDVI